MSTIDPDQVARLVRALHGYALDAAGARRGADMASVLAAALGAFAAGSQFHEEPASFARVLSALAPDVS
jgi:hypothetical protein